MEVKYVKRIVRKKDPYKNKTVDETHRIANKRERKKFPKGFKAMDKFDRELPRHEFAGENSKDEIYISKKVPKQYRKEVIFHEKEERKEINKRINKRKK